MSTGAIGGNPTITRRNFTFSGNLTNFVYYTVPANTISYVNLLHLSSDLNGVFNITLGLVNSDPTIGNIYLPFGSAPSPIAAARTQLFGGPDFILGQDSSGSGGEFVSRIENPLLAYGKGSANKYYMGQLIMYENESLYVSSTTLTGAPIKNIAYTTLEVVSGS